MVLLEQNPFALADRKRLILRTCKTVFAISTPGAVYELQPIEDPFVVILSNAFGGFHLRAVSEYIRHRWPQARILIVGKVSSSLEHHLYDEDLPCPISGGELLLAIEKCRGLRW